MSSVRFQADSSPQQLQLHRPAHVDRGHGRALQDVEHAAVGQAVGARQALHGLVAAHGLDQPVLLAADGPYPARGAGRPRSVRR